MTNILINSILETVSKLYDITESNLILELPARQYHSEIAVNFPSEEIAAPALGLAPLVFQGKQGTMPAQPVRGYTRDTTSHLLKDLIIKWAKFVNNSISYNFGKMLNLNNLIHINSYEIDIHRGGNNPIIEKLPTSLKKYIHHNPTSVFRLLSSVIYRKTLFRSF